MSEQPDPADSGAMALSIDRDAEIPIGVQIAWSLRARIHDGRFKPGQRLPGLRDLAEETGVNINTVRSVYQRLQQEGLTESQQGSGTFVALRPLGPPDVGRIADAAARDAQELGIDPRDVAAALYVSPEPSAPADAEFARRRALRTQIASLERALGELEAEHPGLAPAASAAHPGFGPTLLRAKELEQVRDGILRRLALVQLTIEEQGEDAEPLPAKKKAETRPAAAAGKAKAGPRTRVSPRVAPSS